MRSSALLSLALCLLSVGTNASISPSEFSALFPSAKLTGKGDMRVAYIDPNTHELVKDTIAKVSKRGKSYHEDPLVSLLRKNNAYGFCKAYCAGEKQSTVYTTKSFTKTATIYKTTTTCLPGRKTTVKTITASPPPALIVTKTETVTSTQTTTVTSTESTIFTASADTTSTAILDLTVTADPSTSTLSTTETSTTTEVTVTTFTYTVPFGPTVQTIVPRAAHDVKNPPYLRGYKQWEIKAACTILIKPSPKTVTVPHVKTVSATLTRTLTTVKAPITLLTTSTPLALTYTKEKADVSTITKTSTIITTLTQTTVLTYLHTTTSTAFATTTPIVLTTYTATTTETTTSTSSTTTSLCPSATYGIDGIGGRNHAELKLYDFTTVAQCCTNCYNLPGCNAWAYLGPRSCVAVLGAPPNSGDATSQCPTGLGSYALIPGGGSDEAAAAAGGDGLCSAGQFQI